MSERLKQHSLALAGYLVVAIIFTYPLVLNFTTSISGQMEDNIAAFWFLWWVKRCLIEAGGSLFFTDYLFSPEGLNLSLHSFTYSKTILSIPFQYLFDMISVYNILTLYSYVLSGFSVYLLVEYLVERPGVGFVSGLIYTLSPYHVWHLDHHLDVGSIEMIPLFILFFIRFYQNRKNKDLIAAGIFFVLTSLSCWYYMIDLFYFLIIFFVYVLYTQREEAWQLFKKTAIMLIASFVVISPAIYPLINAILNGLKFHDSPSTFNCVTDLSAAFVPSAKHPMAGWLNLEAFYKSLPCFYWETNVFVGYSVLLVAILGFVKVKNRWTSVMAFTGVAFWILSLGKQLQWKGQILLDSVYLPFFWLVDQIPLVNMIRSPSRFIVMVMLALAVLYGYGLGFILEYLAKKRKPSKPIKIGVMVLAGVLIFLEFMSYPYKLLNVEETTQAGYLARNLPGMDGEYAILELPLVNSYVYNQMLMYRQTLHHKKLLVGHASRIPVGADNFISQSPLRILRNTPEKADLNYFKLLKPFLLQNNIKYIVLNRYMVPDPKYTDFIEKSLRQVFPSHGELNPRIGLYQVY